MLDSQDIKNINKDYIVNALNPIRELYTSALGAKMFMGVGRNSTEEMMFHLSYKPLLQSRVWGKTFLESRNSICGSTL